MLTKKGKEKLKFPTDLPYHDFIPTLKPIYLTQCLQHLHNSNGIGSCQNGNKRIFINMPSVSWWQKMRASERERDLVMHTFISFRISFAPRLLHINESKVLKQAARGGQRWFARKRAVHAGKEGLVRPPFQQQWQNPLQKNTKRPELRPEKNSTLLLLTMHLWVKYFLNRNR